MELFISWSGHRSGVLARRLAEWVPSIVPSVNPFFSADIPGGLQWLDVILAKLERANYGILCVTRENFRSPWMNFEAGSLVRRYKGGLPVCPLLLGLRPYEISGPLSIFQSKPFTERGVKEICRHLGELTQLPQRRLDLNFEAIWPRLSTDVKHDLGAYEEQGSEALTITSPASGSFVARRCEVEGTVANPDEPLWVVVHPTSHWGYWVQPAVRSAEEGRWSTRVYIGEEGRANIGDHFEIRAVLKPDEELREGLVLDSWPSGEHLSSGVEVVRNGS
jgi:hypothetical protein